MKMRIMGLAAVLLTLASLHALAEDKAKTVDLKGAKCPLSGKAASADHFVETDGLKVYFCCEHCPEAYKKDTAKFAEKANHQLVLTGQLVQKGCPLTGGKVNPATEMEIDGAKVSFCCNKCKGKVEAASSDEEKIKLVFSEKHMKQGFKKAE